ncbi:MAG: sulfotransferase family protein, partial [Microcystaceae cyanobacterium]
PYRILFILSHMRSGSSLLTHILNSNPEIIGYGETHINYASEVDFKKLMFKVYWQLKNLAMNHQYILDKILHNHKFLDDNFLISEKVYIIFLLREPQKTLPSIIGIKPHWSEEKALNYYLERLSMLEKYAKLINNKKHSLLVRYDQILNHSESVFEALRNWLETQTEFSEQYQVLKTTGMKGIGDSSSNIKAGRIIRNSQKLDSKFSQELVETAMPYFNQCSQTLSQYCRTIDPLSLK